MTPLDIYLIMSLDDLNDLFVFFSAICVIVALCYGGLWFNRITADPSRWSTDSYRIEAEEKLKQAPKILKIIKLLLGSGFISICIATILPSSKTLAAMYIIPKILNNESIATELKEIYDLAKE